MEAFLEKLLALGQFMSKLTWRKLLQLITLILVLTSGWLIFSLNDQIIGYLKKDKIDSSSPPIVKLTPATIKEMNQMIVKSDLVAGVIVTMVDFRRNARHVIYIHGYNKELEILLQGYDITNAELPIFTQNTDNNRHMIDLINGEFSCKEFDSMILAAYIPATNKYIDQICSSSIPPYYGKFIGTVGLLLGRHPKIYFITTANKQRFTR